MKNIYVGSEKLARNGRKTAIFVSRKFWESVFIKVSENLAFLYIEIKF